MSDQHFSDVQIETTLPKPWEEEQTFNDVLYDWMGRAPWLAISFAVHLLFYFILAAIPWEKFDNKEQVILEATVITPPEEIFEEPEEEVIEEIEEEVVEEPVIQDSEVVDESDEVTDETNDRPESPFQSDQWNNAIGIGGGAGGGGGGKGGRRGGIKRVDDDVARALLAGLDWLADHQSEDGSWNPDSFYLECDKEGEPALGAGNPVHSVGITGLALLAFLGFGDTMSEGQYKDNIRRGIGFIEKQQDRDTGQIGARSSKEWIYNHAIATLALAEAQYASPSPIRKKKLERAVGFIIDAKAPYGGAWRYEVPNPGTADSSVTGWMVFALAAAADAKVEIDKSIFTDALLFFDEVTGGNGQTGYTNLGEGSSRLRHLEDVGAYPPADSRALTAVAILSRLFIGNAAGLSYEDVSGQNSELLEGVDVIEAGIEDMVSNLTPVWPSDLLPEKYGVRDDGEYRGGEVVSPGGGGRIDMYYWYYATYAVYQLSDRMGSAWSKWERALEDAVLASQRSSPPCFEGSWDPMGPWGEEGGRVYSTALMVLCLEVYFRYGKVLGSR